MFVLWLIEQIRFLLYNFDSFCLILLAHLGRRRTRWVYSIPMVCHPHFQTWISLKSVGQSWWNLMCSITGGGGGGGEGCIRFWGISPPISETGQLAPTTTHPKTNNIKWNKRNYIKLTALPLNKSPKFFKTTRFTFTHWLAPKSSIYQNESFWG